MQQDRCYYRSLAPSDLAERARYEPINPEMAVVLAELTTDLARDLENAEEEAFRDAQAAIKALEAECAKLEQHNSELVAELDDADTDRAILRAEIAELKAEIAQLKGDK